jgi:hypothetical protein
MINDEEIDWNEYVPLEDLPDTGPKKFKFGQVWAVGNPTKDGRRSVYRVLVVADGGVHRAALLAGDEIKWRPAARSSNASHAALVHDAVPMEVGQTRRGKIGGAGYGPDEVFTVVSKLQASNETFGVQTRDGKRWNFRAAWPSVLVGDQPATAPPPTALRRVSLNGRDWVDYDSMVDADPWESYPWRSHGTAVATCTYSPDVPVMSTCSYSGGCKLSVGRLGDMCPEHYLVNERDIKRKMELYYTKKQKPVPAAVDRWSHPTMFGGIWDIGR